MKNILVSVGVIAAILSGCTTVEAPKPASLLTPRISPAPQQAQFREFARVKVEMTPIVVRCDDAAAVPWVRKMLGTWLRGYGVPDVRSAARGAALAHGDEAYRVETKADAVVLTANTLQGIRYALYTYRQTWEASRGGVRTTHHTAPQGMVDDWPALGFRGIHFCLTRDVSTPKFMEHQIRMAAYNKLNYAVIESWGVIRSERHPYLGWTGERTYSLAEIRRLGALARELGVTVIPQFNVFGHAAMARWVSSKHATLDVRPEYEPLFEPYAGWNWCLTNPDVLRIQLDLIDELLDAWGNPPYFHIGCDEAEPPSCSRCCAGNYRETVASHLRAVISHLERRGVRPLMWHDMLLRKGDERFEGFYCKGAADAEQLLQALPKSVVICDWFYRDVAHDAYPTLDYFKANGFDVMTCPWDSPKGVAAQTKWVIDHGMFGTLLTTWNHLTSNEYANIWSVGPSAAWGAPGNESRRPDHQHVTTLWRQLGWDMGLKESDYEELGFTTIQSDRTMPSKY